MNKYQQALLSSMRQQMNDWLEKPVSADSEEVERFLHSLKGTAGTIGLSRIATVASELFGRHAGHDGVSKSHEEQLHEFLYPLTKAAYDDECELLAAAGSESGFNPLPPPASTLYKAGEEPLILVLDDDPTFLLYLREHLEKLGWVVMTTMDPDKAVEYFHDLKPDCFITDLNMPERGGLEVLSALHEKARKQFIPTVVMSGFDDKAHRMDSYRLGADEYIVKPFEWDEWIVRIERLIQRKRDVEKAVMVDPLTGAYTKGFLAVLLQSMESRLRHSGQIYSMALIDLDHFKQVNDTYGHVQGDRVLEQFGEAIRRHIGEEAYFVRYGGEEFLLLLPDTRLAEAKALAEQLLAEFSKMPFDTTLGSFHVGFSAGIVEIASAGISIEDRLKAATASMLAAKSGGRGCVVTAGDTHPEAALKKLCLTIVDDDPVMRTMLSESLQEAFSGRFELEIQTYRDGVSYFEQEQTRPDHEGPVFYLLDGIMPRMDGLEILQRLRRKKTAYPVYVIMLTNRKGDRDIVRALELGADDYLTKPFSMSVLEARIERLVKRIHA